VRTIISLLLILSLWSTHSFAKTAKETDKQPKTTVGLLLDRVIDGGTFVAGGKEVRLWGIDAPEAKESYFLPAKLYLETLLKEAPFSCYYKHKDRYQRLVMKCYSGDKDIASMMVRMGVAKDYPKYSKGEYEEDQKFAIEQRYGIWAESK
jgi:endonuclease YncB( thermonuclease family)